VLCRGPGSHDVAATHAGPSLPPTPQLADQHVTGGGTWLLPTGWGALILQSASNRALPPDRFGAAGQLLFCPRLAAIEDWPLVVALFMGFRLEQTWRGFQSLGTGGDSMG
jgi:hypothetical protein